jgi:hypothetical protein
MPRMRFIVGVLILAAAAVPTRSTAARGAIC